MGISTKWPGLLIKGESVTKEQANEIIIRTTEFYWSSNDREFESTLNKEMFGIALPSYELSSKVGLPNYWDKLNEFNNKYNVLNLHYLKNSQILSCWVGGPHGWCDWEGNIGCNNYNIGKWPLDKEVIEELTLIAEAFPFLKMTVQLLNCETCVVLDNTYDSDVIPAVCLQLEVADSKVIQVKPSDEFIIQPKDIDYKFRLNYRERGCTIDQFKNALKQLES